MDKGRRPLDYYKDQNGQHPIFHPDWDSSFTYAIGDIVFHNSKVFVCIQAGKGQDPDTETAYWSGITAVYA